MYSRQAIKDHEALTKIQEAIGWLLRRAPLCGLALLDNYVEITESADPRWRWHDIPIMATDYRHIIYNTDFVRRVPIDEIGFVLMHEWLHIFLRHDIRQGPRTPKRWNYAADYRINELVSTALGMPIPPYLLIPTAQMYLLEAERIYELLEPETEAPKDSATEKGSGDGDNDSDASEKDDENAGSKPYGQTDMLKPYGAEQDRDLGIREMAERGALLLNDTTNSKPLGELTLDWVLERLNELRKVVLPWDQLWYRSTSYALGGEVPNYAKPRKRYLPYIYVPSSLKRRVRDLFIAIDVSGSVRDDDIERFGYVLQKAANEASEIIVVTFDERIREHIVTKTPRTLLKSIKFTQGAHTRTSAVPVFDLMRKLRPRSATIITDGYVDLPENPYPTVTWILTQNHRTPPWGRIFRMG